ncbi:MAG: CDGSH iron-sulfur domain-containing protein [Acidimicrobiia bacterium]
MCTTELSSAGTAAANSNPQIGTETARIRIYPDGPLLVRGDFVLEDVATGENPAHGSVIALCRCGRSGRAPLCDGSHRSPRAG